MRQGSNHTVFILIPQNLTTQAVKWNQDKRFYAPHLIKSISTISLPWDQIEPPPISIDEWRTNKHFILERQRVLL